MAARTTIVLAGQQYAFDRVKEGCNGHEIHRGIQKLFDDAGKKTGPKDRAPKSPKKPGLTAAPANK